MSPGEIVERDEKGRIVKKKLSSEEARAMAKRRIEKPQEETKSSLLQEAGYADEADAPEHLRVLAEIAASGRSGAVPALRDFLRLTRPAEIYPEAESIKPKPGKIYYFTGDEYIELIMTQKYLSDLAELTAHARRKNPDMKVKNKYFRMA